MITKQFTVLNKLGIHARPAAQPAAPAYSAGSNDDFALIEDEGDLPF